MGYEQRSDHDELHDRGLAFDLSTLLERRRVLGLIAGAGLASLVGCSDSVPGPQAGPSAPGNSPGNTSGQTSSASDPASAASCARLPEETAGPFPGDGSNGPNVLTQSGIVRSDIRSSFGPASGIARGVPLTITLTVVDAAKGCAPYPGAAVYLWHCDINGAYSMYSQSVAGENYLRGVQAAGATGTVTFTSIFPGAYPGRWPHAHFEVYPSLAGATAARNKIATSQLALPAAVCQAVYATDGYGASARTLARASLDSDAVFRDGSASQLAAVTGDVSSGFVARLAVPV